MACGAVAKEPASRNAWMTHARDEQQAKALPRARNTGFRDDYSLVNLKLHKLSQSNIERNHGQVN
jgi:hypothetical protein